MTLRGSRRFKPEGAKIVVPVDAKEPVVVSVYLKNPAERQHVRTVANVETRVLLFRSKIKGTVLTVEARKRLVIVS